jgi:hypothetical protein
MGHTTVLSHQQMLSFVKRGISVVFPLNQVDKVVHSSIVNAWEQSLTSYNSRMHQSLVSLEASTDSGDFNLEFRYNHQRRLVPSKGRCVRG